MVKEKEGGGEKRGEGRGEMESRKKYNFAWMERLLDLKLTLLLHHSPILFKKKNHKINR